MSITVNFLAIYKKYNSTLSEPDSSKSYECNVRDGCGVLYPDVEILDSMNFNPAMYTHMYIPAFQRTYWITESKFLNRKWTVSGKVDVLISYKSDILVSSHYVLRSSSEVDPAITDDLIYRKCFTRFAITSADTGFLPPSFIQGSGSFVVGVVGKGASSSMVTYYVLSVLQMVQLRNYLLSMDNDDIYHDWDTAGDEPDTGTGGTGGTGGTTAAEVKSAKITAGAIKALLNPFQYIVSCMWFPFSVYVEAGDTIKFGFWDSEISAGIVSSSYTARFDFTLTRPTRHDDASLPGMYFYSQPFANLTLYCPPFEAIEIQASEVGYSTVLCSVFVDLITGAATLVAKQSLTGIPQLPVIGQRSAQIGVPIQISQITTDYIGAISSGFGGSIKSLAAIGYDLGSKVGEILGTGAKYTGLLNGQLSEAKISGAAGGFAGLQIADKAYLILRYTDVTEGDNDHVGRPLCKIRRIGTLSGFCLCRDGEVSAQATDEELREIENFLTTGFFIEESGE